jgi:Cytochrome P450
MLSPITSKMKSVVRTQGRLKSSLASKFDAQATIPVHLHPDIAFTLPHIVLDGRDHLVWHFILAGYRVGINLAVVHYDMCVFGKDANKFNPSRWFDHNDAVTMDEYMIHFGAGLRTCMGEKHRSPLQSSFIGCSLSTVTVPCCTTNMHIGSRYLRVKSTSSAPKSSECSLSSLLVPQGLGKHTTWFVKQMQFHV